MRPIQNHYPVKPAPCFSTQCKKVPIKQLLAELVVNGLDSRLPEEQQYLFATMVTLSCFNQFGIHNIPTCVFNSQSFMTLAESAKLSLFSGNEAKQEKEKQLPICHTATIAPLD